MSTNHVGSSPLHDDASEAESDTSEGPQATFPTAEAFLQEDNSTLEWVMDSGGGACPRPHSESTLRVAGMTAGVAVLALPWAVAMGFESVLRRARGSREHYNVRGAGWAFVSEVYGDITSLASRGESYQLVRWSFPAALAVEEDGTGLVALTIDDAPGDNPEMFAALLDTLLELKVKATFFCTTSLIVGPMVPLLRRAVQEGHEVCNHCPEDKSYATLSEVNFEAALNESAQALQDFQADLEAHSIDVPWLRRTRKRWRWFRPPMGLQSRAMAKVLHRLGYSSVLGDVFSNDVFVGGTLRDHASGPETVRWNVNYSASRCKAGSVVIFHVPQRTQRLASAEIVKGFVLAAAAKGLKCTTLSDVAATVDENTAKQSENQEQQEETSTTSVDDAVSPTTESLDAADKSRSGAPLGVKEVDCTVYGGQ
jgi:peptidoglycan/xylan/chitin deacetylase (PgdA/CDA1 family)